MPHKQTFREYNILSTEQIILQWNASVSLQLLSSSPSYHAPFAGQTPIEIARGLNHHSANIPSCFRRSCANLALSPIHGIQKMRNSLHRRPGMRKIHCFNMNLLLSVGPTHEQAPSYVNSANAEIQDQSMVLTTRFYFDHSSHTVVRGHLITNNKPMTFSPGLFTCIVTLGIGFVDFHNLVTENCDINLFK